MSKVTAPTSKNITPIQKAVNPTLTVVPKTIRGDTYMVMADTAYQPDDEFVNLYYTTNQKGGLAMKPPFDPRTLKHLSQHNNILAQCVEAMSVNIDGTGHEFLPTEEGSEIDKKELEIAESFFKEPFPGVSFLGMRRDLRQDIEGVGYGYLEVLRSISEEMVGVRHMDVTSLRMVKLDDAVQVTKTVTRAGKPVNLTFFDRERRFLQIVSGKNKTFFREFGATRHLHRMTGEWETKEKPVDVADRATEIIMVGVTKDYQSPYFLPRWINQLPSVVGSRKAEEQNLEFFDAGGMPPAIIFIQGGSMVGPASEQLRTYLSAQNKSKGRAIVVELQSSSGSLESSGSVSAKVERFGAQQANDAMFSKYDATAEDHVRVGFRLPPLFLGKASDYNFATAQTSYMVAEAQVFQPERTEFDDLINYTLIKALGLTTLKFKSKPITLKDVDTQLAGIELIADKVSGEDLVSEVNKITGLSLEYDEEAAKAAEEAKAAAAAQMQGKPAGGPADPVSKKPDPKAPLVEDPTTTTLARKFAHLTGRAALKFDLSPEEQVDVIAAVENLEGAELVRFNTLLASYSTTKKQACEH